MERKLAVTFTFLILFWGVLVSCQSDAPIVELIGTAVSTQQAELVMETAVPPTNTPTQEPSPTATSTSAPTVTATARATAVPTPSFSLTQREPSLTEIEEFLSLSPVLFFYPDRLELLSLREYFTEHDLTEHTEIFYEDVNGDGEDDLVLADMFPSFWSDGFIVITLWNSNQYGTPLVIMDGAKYSPGLRVSFEDWTNDTTPEVIFDFSSDIGGSGFIETTWTRYVIHCQDSCNVIWWGITGQLSSYSSVGLITTEIERNVDESGNPTVTIVDESFYAPAPLGPGAVSGNYRVFTPTMTTYTWNGSFFEQTGNQILEPKHVAAVNPELSVIGKTGVSAIIQTEFDNSDAFRKFFICTLKLNETVIGDPFECLPDFTNLSWQDITNDGKEELVVVATGLGTQQLLAYRVNEQETIQIANITGDIIRSDLFGVHLEDVDGDGQLEILSGHGYVTEGSDCKIYEGVFGPGESELCWWNELNLWEEIYRWDGRQFVSDSEN